MAFIQDEERRKDPAIMRHFIAIIFFVILFSPWNMWGQDMKTILLPKPRVKGAISVEEAIGKRRSVRSYSLKDVSQEHISQLLWACQGITDENRRLRAAPSAGALYPLEVYLIKKEGVFLYRPEGHALQPVLNRDIKKELAQASWGQDYIKDAAVDIVICAVYGRVTARYGERGVRYTDMEAGHAAQNVFLQAVALGLDSVPIGAFDDGAVSKLLNLPKDTKPLYILPVGYKR